MKRIVIHSNEYERVPVVSRIGSRVLIEDNGFVLFSYLRLRNEYLLPGGGIEKGETPEQCAERECKEECGLITVAKSPELVIDEYYFENHWRNYYSRASIKDFSSSDNDEKEKELGLVPIWFEVERLAELPEIQMNWNDISESKLGVIYAVKASHYREYSAYCILSGKDLPVVPESLRCVIDSVEIFEDY